MSTRTDELRKRMAQVRAGGQRGTLAGEPISDAYVRGDIVEEGPILMVPRGESAPAETYFDSPDLSAEPEKIKSAGGLKIKIVVLVVLASCAAVGALLYQDFKTESVPSVSKSRVSVQPVAPTPPATTDSVPKAVDITPPAAAAQPVAPITAQPGGVAPAPVAAAPTPIISTPAPAPAVSQSPAPPPKTAEVPRQVKEVPKQAPVAAPSKTIAVESAPKKAAVEKKDRAPMNSGARNSKPGKPLGAVIPSKAKITPPVNEHVSNDTRSTPAVVDSDLVRVLREARDL